MITKTEKKHTKDTQNIWVKSGRLFFLLCLTNAVGYIGSVFITPKALEWYHSLILSELTPPGFLFGLVWTVLYFLMAFSAFLVWNRTSPRPFVLQLAFNLIWPFVFFYLKEPIAGLAVILMMMYFIYRTIRGFGSVSKIAGWLMVPVFVWSGFAFYLNLIVVLYNTAIGVWLGLI